MCWRASRRLITLLIECFRGPMESPPVMLWPVVWVLWVTQILNVYDMSSYSVDGGLRNSCS